MWKQASVHPPEPEHRSRPGIWPSLWTGVRRWRWFLIGIAILLLATPVTWANPLGKSPHQTLPPFTPTFTPTPIPTATPTFTPEPGPPSPTPVPPTPTPAPPTSTPPPAGPPPATDTPAPPTQVPTTETPTPSPTPEAELPAPTLSATQVELTMRYEPLWVRQGESFRVIFEIANNGPETAVGLALRDRFPASLRPTDPMTVDAGDGEVRWDQEEDSAVLTVAWAALPPGESRQVTVALTVAPDVPDGAVIDNLAVVQADNAPPNTAGMSLGMPPFLLPTFR